MAKTITLEQTGYWVEGTAVILCWDNDESAVNMDPFHVDSLDDIPANVNDGQFGCQRIIRAECMIYEDYEGTHVFLENRNYDTEDLVDAKRGV